ncbi:MAG: hypothetical protein RLZZ584_4028, partial [Pseudomonadota bacterium]
AAGPAVARRGAAALACPHCRNRQFTMRGPVTITVRGR